VSSTDRAAYSAERSVLVELNIYLYLFIHSFIYLPRPYVYTVSVEWATVPASFALRRSATQVTATDQQTACSACGAGGAQTAISTQTAVRPAPDHVWFPCHVAQRRESQVQPLPRSKHSPLGHTNQTVNAV